MDGLQFCFVLSSNDRRPPVSGMRLPGPEAHKLAIWFALHTWFRQAEHVRGVGFSFDMPILRTVDPGRCCSQLRPSTRSSADIAALAPNLEPEFDIWRTGQGAPAQGDTGADPIAAGRRAIAQTNTDKMDCCFPLAIYKPYSGKNFSVTHFDNLTIRPLPDGGK